MKTLVALYFTLLFSCTYYSNPEPTSKPKCSYLILPSTSGKCMYYKIKGNQTICSIFLVYYTMLPFKFMQTQCEYDLNDVLSEMRCTQILLKLDFISPSFIYSLIHRPFMNMVRVSDKQHVRKKQASCRHLLVVRVYTGIINSLPANIHIKRIFPTYITAKTSWQQK